MRVEQELAHGFQPLPRSQVQRRCACMVGDACEGGRDRERLCDERFNPFLQQCKRRASEARLVCGVAALPPVRTVPHAVLQLCGYQGRFRKEAVQQRLPVRHPGSGVGAAVRFAQPRFSKVSLDAHRLDPREVELIPGPIY